MQPRSLLLVPALFWGFLTAAQGPYHPGSGDAGGTVEPGSATTGVSHMSVKSGASGMSGEFDVSGSSGVSGEYGVYEESGMSGRPGASGRIGEPEVSESPAPVDDSGRRNAIPEEDKIRIARIQYRGGGDWYNDPSALSNLIDFADRQIPISVRSSYDDVSIGSRDLHDYPFVFMTGHGNIDVNETEASNMREYLDNGGFLYIDDDYGFDPYVRPVIERIFPDEELIELHASHPIYSMVFDFPDGLPKIHEHDGKPPQGFGIFRNGRLVIYYTYETNLSDGWAYDVHDNPEHIVEMSLQMGVNLLVYAFTR